MVPTSLPRRDIRAVYAARHVVHGQFLSLYGRVRTEDGEGARTAVVAGRGVGTAVDRNRAKRRLRAVLREGGMPSGFDVVAVAKVPARTVPYPLLCREYQRLRERLAARLGRPA